MRSLSDYHRVRITHVEQAIETHITDAKVAEGLITICREAFTIAPAPFWHCANILSGFGYKHIVDTALSLACDA